MHLGCCEIFGKRKNTLACGSCFLRFPKLSQHPACMNHTILHGKPFSNPLLSSPLSICVALCCESICMKYMDQSVNQNVNLVLIGQHSHQLQSSLTGFGQRASLSVSHFPCLTTWQLYTRRTKTCKCLGLCQGEAG